MMRAHNQTKSHESCGSLILSTVYCTKVPWTLPCGTTVGQSGFIVKHWNTLRLIAPIKQTSYVQMAYIMQSVKL